uniref:Uncharacterized protein n=1 Tax=viral metagenome TaxID=1070528 RepID=A0A6C0ILG2_9ZZZZ
MKFYDTSYEDYIKNVTSYNLHPQLTKHYDKFPQDIHKLKNIILFGPPGTGKYSQCLYIIKKYSPSSLKYEKKANVLYNKEPFFFKISDIHFEIDMSLLGCNSKQLWHEIYMLIIDIISTKQHKSGIIVCKNFHKINNELLEIFYSYMQSNNYSHLNITFFIITDEYSFINDNISNSCNTISISRPSKTQYNKIIFNNFILHENENDKNNKNENRETQNDFIKLNQNVKTLNISNIKNIHNNKPSYKLLCDKILSHILNYNEINLLYFREIMYEILIFEMNIYSVIWYILQSLINEEKKINSENISKTMIKTFEFLKYYNNNYRPIFHLENYFLFLCQQIADKS